MTFERNSRGWVFWNFKTEQADEWNALKLAAKGIFPKGLTQFKYPNICNS